MAHGFVRGQVQGIRPAELVADRRRDAEAETFERARFILQHEAAYGFQIQLTYPTGQQIALDYRVSSDGSIRESAVAGGIDYYALPAGTESHSLQPIGLDKVLFVANGQPAKIERTVPLDEEGSPPPNER